ncbi:MAG: hypothetical protein VKS61_16970 [Candidatus Sericytochromatia bacterium]|nr:hypothetical protein [Candidatus Sericytochromatia bacterium]
MTPIDQTPGGAPFQPLAAVPPPPPVPVPALPPLPPLGRDSYAGGTEPAGGTGGDLPNQPVMPPSAYQAAVTHSDLMARLQGWQTMGNAALEIERLPAAQAAALATALFTDLSFQNDRALNLVASVVAKRIREPGMVDAMRALNQVPRANSQAMYEAKLKAAITMVHFGTPADLPGILRLTLTDLYGSDAQQGLLIDHLASKPALLQNPATLDTLVAALRGRTSGERKLVATAQALARIPHPKARDAIGESPVASGAVYRNAPLHAVLDALGAHKPPFTELTIHNLRQVVKEADPGSADRAKALLKKAGVKP